MNPPALTSLEFLGALSARFAHALSNQLSIVTGNLCLAAALRDDPEKLEPALKAALKSANEAGALLSRLAELRRGFALEAHGTPANDFIQFLSDWIGERRGWRLESDPRQGLASSDQVGIPLPWLRFILDCVAGPLPPPGSPDGSIKIIRARTRKTTHMDSSASLKTQTGLLHLTLAAPAARPIDWESVRRDLSTFPLAAALELLSQLPSAPESALVRPGLQETKFTLPLF